MVPGLVCAPQLYSGQAQSEMPAVVLMNYGGQCPFDVWGAQLPRFLQRIGSPPAGCLSPYYFTILLIEWDKVRQLHRQAPVFDYSALRTVIVLA